MSKTMDTTWLDSFRGQHVTVLTTAGSDERSDTGTLVQIGSGWLQLAKDNGEMILVPSTAIRIVKLLDMTQLTPGVQKETTPNIVTQPYNPNEYVAPGTVPP